MPAEFLNSNTTFAAFSADARLIDPEGFTERPKEPLRAAAFTEALPSPPFPASRLEAVRPALVSTRAHVLPEVTGATFDTSTLSAENAAPVAVAPPAPVVVITPPPAAAAPAAPQDPPVVVNPLSVILLTPPGAGTSGSSTAGSTPAPSAPATPAAPVTTAHGGDRHSPPPENRKSNAPGRRFRSGEMELYREVQKSFDAHDYSRALTSLDAWSQRFPQTDFEYEREFEYIEAFDAAGQPAKVLEVAGTLLNQGLAAALPDPRQALTMVYLASLNLQKIPRPNHAQIVTGQQAAHELLERLPEFFAAGSRPPNTTEAEWRKLRQSLETVANGALAMVQHRRASR